MFKPKIGVGVITYKRPECLKLFLEQLELNKPYYEYVLHVEEDNTSIAKAKNACLHDLFEVNNCDYVFLFEDDCFPVAKWWDLIFLRSGREYSLYMDGRYSCFASDGSDIAKYYEDCSGVFMFLSKNIFEKTGYFNESYENNGLEHIGHSDRLKRACGEGGYACLTNTDKFIYSLDLQGVKSWNVFHKSTIEGLRGKAFQSNQQILNEELKNEKLYYGSSISGKLV